MVDREPSGARSRRPIIGVMGAGEPSTQSMTAAGELGALLAQCGWIVLTGGRPAGVMAAASAGAKRVPGSLTLGILPGAGGRVAPDVDVAIFTALGDARNAVNVLTCDAIVACGVEGPGTASEVALALKADKPVILLGASLPARAFFTTIRSASRLFEATTPAEAVRIMEQDLAIPRWPSP
jgi:uncharacterized protein (TIGR00725 family)